MSARKFFWLCLSICFLWTNLGFMLTLAINWGEIPGPPALRDSPVFYSDIINFCWIQSIPQNNVRIKHTCRAAACFMVLFTCDSFFLLQAGLRSTDTVLEIGPGTGNLTVKLLEQVKQARLLIALFWLFRFEYCSNLHAIHN